MKPAINADQHIFLAAEDLFDKALLQRKDLVRLIGVKVSNLINTAQQLNMLSDSEEKMSHLNLAIDDIRKKYGFKAIETGQTLVLKNKCRHRKER